MNPKKYFLFAVLFCLSAGKLLGALIDTHIHFVWMRNEDVRSEFFIKTSDYKKIGGSLKSLSPEAQKYRGENPFSVYRKNDDGIYENCGEIEIPAGTRNCAVILVPDWGNNAETFAPKVLDLDSTEAQGGELIFCNLSSLTLRAKVRGNAVEKYLPDECRKLYALDSSQESGSFSFKLLASATSAENIKRTWRYGNSMRLVKSQRYFLIALPGKPKDDPEKPPQCELITLRAEAK